VRVVHADRERPVVREQCHEPAPGAAELLLGVAVGSAAGAGILLSRSGGRAGAVAAWR
jgi:hypothetical protein